MQAIIEWVLNIGGHNPDLVALLVGNLVGFVFTCMIERYFLPVSSSQEQMRRLQGLTFIICWLASGTASAILWVSMDPADALSVRLGVSYTISILSFAGYPIIARLATNLFPKIASAWAEKSQ